MNLITPRQIRMARSALNLTLTDISERTGLHRNTLTNVESDDAKTRKSTLLSLKRCLNLKESSLVVIPASV